MKRGRPGCQDEDMFQLSHWPVSSEGQGDVSHHHSPQGCEKACSTTANRRAGGALFIALSALERFPVDIYEELYLDLFSILFRCAIVLCFC